MPPRLIAKRCRACLNNMRLILTFLTILALLTNCSRQTDNNEIENNETIIEPIVPQPRFPGDIEGLKQYLKENYNWTQGQGTIEGTVYVGFLVTEDGSVSEPHIVRGLCETCDAEAIRLIKNMPKWEPATEDGKPKTERVVLPIKFGLTNPTSKGTPYNNSYNAFAFFCLFLFWKGKRLIAKR